MVVQIPPLALPVRASAEDLAASLDALLGNVFAHTSDGTPLMIEVHPQPPGAVVVVEDGGPGLAVPDPGAPTGPTGLARGSSGAGSTGLGLDVARRTAEASGGWLVLGRGPLGGARVELYFGPPGGASGRRQPGHQPDHPAGG
jgi:signal transduction histidine kinase